MTMKKYIFSSLILLSSFSQAQVIVNESGNMGIGTTPGTIRLSVRTTKNSGISSVVDSVTSTGVNAITGTSYTNGTYTYGVTGSTGIKPGASSSGYCYGVCGIADGSDWKKYGVFGRIGSTGDGAAIYGTSYNDGGHALSARYAGYFDGAVYVSGNFNHSGVLLSSLQAADNTYSPIADQKETDKTYIEKLLLLQPSTFYSKLPIRNSNEQDVRAGEAMLKAVYGDNYVSEVDVDVTQLEKQVYSKQHYGLSAEELEEVFPDLVYDNEDGTKSINYVEMVPILVQAINELNAKIEVLEGGDGGVKRSKSQATNIDEMAENVTMLSLAQNKPNPFGTSTTIEVSIPEDVQTAFIYVYDLTGKKLQQVDIAARGKQAVTLNAATLTDGMYLYSLIADGKVVETRRMIVEK